MSGWEIAALGLSTSATVYATVQQGKANERAAERDSTAAEIDATAREIQRTKRMNAYLASVNAQAGAGGVAAGSGSLGNIQRVAARENKIGVQSEKANKEAIQAASRDRAKSAKRQSLAGSVSAVGDGAIAGYTLIKD